MAAVFPRLDLASIASEYVLRLIKFLQMEQPEM